MDLHELEYYIAIAEEQNLSKAAERLYISQPALSQYLKKTEQKLGVKLFRRLKSNALELTDAGKRYLSCCKDIVELWYTAEQDLMAMQQNEAVRLSLGVVTQQAAHKLSEIIFPIQPKYPNLRIDIQLALPSELQEKVLRGELHAAFPAYNNEHPLLKYYNFTCKELELLVPADHPMAQYSYINNSQAAKIPLSDIGAAPFAAMNKNTVLGQIEEEYFRQINFQPNIVATVTHGDLIPTFVASGNYLGLAPKNEVVDERLAPIALDTPAYYKIGAIVRKDLFVSSVLRQIIELFGKYYQQEGTE